MKSLLFTDQLNRKIELTKPPTRIISLVPSQTEFLYDINAKVVGITKFCIHPKQWYKNKTRVGGTKQLKFDLIKALKPDLIIGNKEENTKEQIDQLAKDYPVWLSDVKDFDTAIDMMKRVGSLVQKEGYANAIIQNILAKKEAFASNPITGYPSVAYFIWQKPYMIAGRDTYIHEMLQLAGFSNSFEDCTRYPEVQLSELSKRKPDYIFLSSEPFPFNESHFMPFRLACPKARIHIVDGEAFSWYGSRMIKAFDYFQTLRTMTKQ